VKLADAVAAMRFVLEETPAKVGDDRTPPEIWVWVNPIYYIKKKKKIKKIN